VWGGERQKAEGRKQKCSARAFLLSAFCFLPFVAAANSLTVDKRSLAFDDALTITLTLDGAFSDADVPRLPLQNLVVDGEPSVSTSFEWINGQSSRRKILRYSAHPAAPGAAFIGPVVVRSADGQLDTLPSIALEVLPDRLLQLTDPAAILHELLATSRDPIFLVAEVDRREAYVGEEIVVSWTLYNGTNVEQYALADIPKLADFWSEELDVRNEQPRQVNLGGTVVQRVPIRRVALFPLRSGTLVVPPLAINGAVMRRMRGADPFGMFEGTVVEIHRRSAPLTIVARPIPPGPPVAAVGEVAMSCSTPLQQNGGPVVVDVTMTGRANLRAVPPPRFARPIDGSVEIVEGKLTVDRSRDDATMTRRWRYLLFPPDRGIFAVPPLTTTILTPAGERRELRCEERLLPVERASPEAPRTPPPSRNVVGAVRDARLPIAVVCALLLVLAFAAPRVQRAARIRREMRKIAPGDDFLPSLEAWIAERGVDPHLLVREPSDRGDAYRALRSLLDERVGAGAAEVRGRLRDVVAAVIETSTPPTE
jgi:hypothetical protein